MFLWPPFHEPHFSVGKRCHFMVPISSNSSWLFNVKGDMGKFAQSGKNRIGYKYEDVEE